MMSKINFFFFFFFFYQLGILSPVPPGEKEVSQTPHYCTRMFVYKKFHGDMFEAQFNLYFN